MYRRKHNSNARLNKQYIAYIEIYNTYRNYIQDTIANKVDKDKEDFLIHFVCLSLFFIDSALIDKNTISKLINDKTKLIRDSKLEQIDDYILYLKVVKLDMFWQIAIKLYLTKDCVSKRYYRLIRKIKSEF